MMGYDGWRHIWTPSPSFWFQKSHWLDHKNLFRSTISEVLDLRSPAGSRLDSSDRLSQFRAILGGRRDLMINSSKQYTPSGDLSSLFNRKSRHADPRERIRTMAPRIDFEATGLVSQLSEVESNIKEAVLNLEDAVTSANKRNRQIGWAKDYFYGLCRHKSLLSIVNPVSFCHLSLSSLSNHKVLQRSRILSSWSDAWRRSKLRSIIWKKIVQFFQSADWTWWRPSLRTSNKPCLRSTRWVKMRRYDCDLSWSNGY